MKKVIKFNNLKEESDFIEDLNEIKNLILVYKNNYKDYSDFLDDLETLYYKVDDLLKYL